MKKETKKKVALTFLILFTFSFFYAGLAFAFHSRGMSWLTEARLLFSAVAFTAAYYLFRHLRSGYFSRLTDRSADRAMTALLFFLSLLPAITAALGYRLMGWL